MLQCMHACTCALFTSLCHLDQASVDAGSLERDNILRIAIDNVFRVAMHGADPSISMSPGQTLDYVLTRSPQTVPPLRTPRAGLFFCSPPSALSTPPVFSYAHLFVPVCIQRSRARSHMHVRAYACMRAYTCTECVCTFIRFADARPHARLHATHARINVAHVTDIRA